MEVHLILGPMFSEKSTTLFRKINRYKSINKNVLVVNHSHDSRCGNEIQTHDSVTQEAIKVSKLNDIDNSFLLKADVIAIDEAQFFPDVYEFVKKWETHEKKLYISGLDGGYRRNKIGNLLDIIPLCDSVTKLNALCTMCQDGTRAPFTHRKSNDLGEVLIGNKEQYESLCRKHYIFMQQER